MASSTGLSRRKWFVTKEEFGEEVLCFQREELEMTQTVMGKKTGVKQSAISKWETGVGTPGSLVRLKKAARAYHLSPYQKKNWIFLKYGHSTLEGTSREEYISLPIDDLLEYLDIILIENEKAINTGSPETVSLTLLEVFLPVLHEKYLDLRGTSPPNEPLICRLARAWLQYADSVSMWETSGEAAGVALSTARELEILNRESGLKFPLLLAYLSRSSSYYLVGNSAYAFEASSRAKEIVDAGEAVDPYFIYALLSFQINSGIITNHGPEAKEARNDMEDLLGEDIDEDLIAKCLGTLARFELETGSKKFWEKNEDAQKAIKFPGGGYKDRYGAMRLHRREIKAMKVLRDICESRLDELVSEAKILSGGQYGRLLTEIERDAEQVRKLLKG